MSTVNTNSEAMTNSEENKQVEREAEKLYPYHRIEGEMHAAQYVDAERAAYIRGRTLSAQRERDIAEKAWDVCEEAMTESADIYYGETVLNQPSPSTNTQ